MSKSKLNQLNLYQAQQGLQSGQFSATELVQACLTEIENTEKDVHAFVTIFADQALAQAKQADKEIVNNPNIFKTKPLFGLPIALKDNYLTKGQRTTASSKVLDDYLPQYDATVTNKLKQAGAIILGKTNMDAWAHGSSTETSAYGPTKNPRDLTRIPGGSSGGSSAAVVANYVLAAMGTETAGSIRGPASWTGHVGLKPTYGRLSRYGIIAMGSSLDSPGPMTKTVYDAAWLLALTAGHDSHDATTASIEVPSYHLQLNPDRVKGLKIGLPKEYFLAEAQPGINQLVKQAALELEKMGATLTEVSLPTTKLGIATYTVVQRSEVFSNLARYDGIRYGHDRSYFGEEAKRRMMLGAHALKISQDGKYYRLAQRVRQKMLQDFQQAFSQVDLLLAPTMPSIAPKLGASKDQAMFGELADMLQEPSALTGLTGITLPCGLVENMPVGFQLIGNHFQEQLILDIAYAYEQNIDWSQNVYQK